MADSPFTKIVVMQLFYELKQKFPTVPDQVVSECIQQNSYDKKACELLLSREFKKYQLHSYPAGIVEKMSEGKEKHLRPRSLCLMADNQQSTAIGTTATPPATAQSFSRRSFGRQSLDGRRMVDSSRAFPSGAPAISDGTCVTVDQQQQLRSKCHSANDVNSASTTSSSSLLNVRSNVKSNLFGGSVPVNLNVAADKDNRQSVGNIEISSNRSDIFVSDLKLHLRSDECGCERTSLRVKYSKRKQPPFPPTSYSDPCTPSSGVAGHPPSDEAADTGSDLQLISLLSPLSTAAVVKTNSPSSPTVASKTSDDIQPSNEKEQPAKRPFTSVNLTLRPPSSEPQPVIDISANGSNLIYSMLHCDDKLGYQNQFQISISEEGKTTLSASRTKRFPTAVIPESLVADSTDTSLPLVPVFPQPPSPVIVLRLTEQIKCRRKLENELEREKKSLEAMQIEVAAMEKDLENRKRQPFASERVIQLRFEVRHLEIKCAELINQVDLAAEKAVPEEKVSEDIHETNNPSPQQRRSGTPLPQLTIAPVNSSWTCHMCTFRNHPMLPKCEQCEMVRVDMNDVLPNILRPTATSRLPAIHPRV